MATDNIQPASADNEPKPAQPLESPKPNETPAPPAGVQEEPFDKERAMETIRKLRDIEKKAKQDAKELEQLKAEEQKRKDAELSEVERLRKQADELAKAKAELELNILRRDVIAKTGLPAALADRLKGTTEEELTADAETLMKSLPQIKQKGQSVTNPGQASLNETEQQKRERLFGRQNNIFDVKAIEAGGGGVVWPDKQE